jgi:hypothetical protein
MLLEVIKLIVILILLFMGYRLILKMSGAENYAIGVTSYAPPPSVFEERFRDDNNGPDMGPPEAPNPPPINHTITPAGPNAPAQQAPHEIRHIMAEEQPRDPFAEEQDDAYAPERVRNPERMYRAAPNNVDTGMAVGGGIAAELSAVPQQMGQFSPEMAQNGGMFMDGIAANDLFDNGNFASY